jgi:hypothetical protein
VFEASWPYHRSMIKLVPEWIWRQVLKSNSSAASDWKPAVTILGGGDLAAILRPKAIPGKDGNVDLAAAGDLKCRTCASGGSWGTTGMYEVERRILCTSCAVKRLGAEDLPEIEKIRTLMPYLLPPRR